jgi:hypothetical protein
MPELQLRALPRVPGGKRGPWKAGILQNIGGGIAMNRTDCKFEKVSHFSVAIALFAIAIGLSIISVVALPVVGFFIAAPVFILSYWFLIAPRSQECTLN